MEAVWSAILLASKWLFVGLIYAALFVVWLAVRREMKQRLVAGSVAVGGPGRLRVLNPGSDTRLQAGSLVALQNETTLGAAPDNDIVLDDRFVSGHHARLRWDGARWWLQDMGSKNGTLAAGQLVPPHQEQPVAAGSQLRLGDVVMELMD
jgi:pSer/pThr/pTyr-binding forkhead associated (FHA) protein